MCADCGPRVLVPQLHLNGQDVGFDGRATDIRRLACFGSTGVGGAHPRVRERQVAGLG